MGLQYTASLSILQFQRHPVCVRRGFFKACNLQMAVFYAEYLWKSDEPCHKKCIPIVRINSFSGAF